jgi:coenzyme PQQ precursor peptide PqqA
MPSADDGHFRPADRHSQGDVVMDKKVWQAPKVETTPVSMEVTMYLPAQA